MTNHTSATAAPGLVELTEEQMDQVAGGVGSPYPGEGGGPSPYPGYGIFTAFTEPSTPINSSPLGYGVTAGASGRYPGEGQATASNTPIPPGGTP
jgi:hypothetical protein